jgi:hypothetical protein
MLYQILLPPEPIDPRDLEIDSLQRLHEIMPCTIECDLEEDAVQAVHDVYPSAIAMPVPVSLGSGKIMLLGILDDVRKAPTDDVSGVAFAMFVHAVAEHVGDRGRIKNLLQFSRRAWRTPVQVPSRDTKAHAVEVRASDLETPMRVEAKVGRISGHLVIHCEIGGIAMSVRFEDPAVDLR